MSNKENQKNGLPPSFLWKVYSGMKIIFWRLLFVLTLLPAVVAQICWWMLLGKLWFPQYIVFMEEACGVGVSDDFDDI